MYLKTNENKNRINIPVPLGANQKIGIFFSKQQKTKQLEQENANLAEKLEKALKNFQEQNGYLKQLKTKNTTTQNIISVLSLENQMLQSQNEKTQSTLVKLQKQKQQFKEKEGILTVRMTEIQRELFQNTKKYEDSSNLLQRYQEELKSEKTLRYAPDSIVNVVAKLQKDLELLKRNVAIHENKLQGKIKYQTLLQKKQQIYIEKEQKSNAKTIKSSKKTLNIYEKTSFSTGLISLSRKKLDELQKKETQANNTKIMQEKRQNAKNFNDLTRKKNALMMQSNSKKAF